MKRVLVRADAATWCEGKQRRAAEIFFVPRDRIEANDLPACVKRVQAERVEEPEFVEVRL